MVYLLFFEKNKYPCVDVFIMHFTKEMMRRGTFEPIIRVKGTLGHSIPILVIEGETVRKLKSQF